MCAQIYTCSTPFQWHQSESLLLAEIQGGPLRNSNPSPSLPLSLSPRAVPTLRLARKVGVALMLLGGLPPPSLSELCQLEVEPLLEPVGRGRRLVGRKGSSSSSLDSQSELWNAAASFAWLLLERRLFRCELAARAELLLLPGRCSGWTLAPDAPMLMLRGPTPTESWGIGCGPAGLPATPTPREGSSRPACMTLATTTGVLLEDTTARGVVLGDVCSSVPPLSASDRVVLPTGLLVSPEVSVRADTIELLAVISWSPFFMTIF